VTELLAERALKRAAELDEYYSANKKPVGPLHGLPISVKEHVGMKDLDLNAGFISWIGNVGTADALILQILYNAGAVFYVRTTQPQSLMHLETSSNIYGETVNPYNRALTSGGSSGGEGALVGIKGSCLGIGTDIGGSIRSPAANCGVFGLRPTSYRLPNVGCAATMLAQEHVVPVIGPLSTSLEGIKSFMKTIIDAKPWLQQPSLLPFPWKEGNLLEKEGEKTKLRVAVLWDDGIVKPHPPVIRALKGITEGLKGVEGVEIVDWVPYKHDHAWEIIVSSLIFYNTSTYIPYRQAFISQMARPRRRQRLLLRENLSAR
jgi:amidase